MQPMKRAGMNRESQQATAAVPVAAAARPKRRGRSPQEHWIWEKPGGSKPRARQSDPGCWDIEACVARVAPWHTSRTFHSLSKSSSSRNLSAVSERSLDSKQSASAAQFDRQSDRYGKSHILADTHDVAMGLQGVVPSAEGTALDVATGGGHTALWLARQGWQVTAGDIAPRMLENAQNLCAQAGVRIETRLFPAEDMPFADCSFDLVTVRVAPHHFSSPSKFVHETARVLKPLGKFLLIDGSVPDDNPETEEWLDRVEKWRDPSHVRLLSRKAWVELARAAGLEVIRSELNSLKQPDLEWYFNTAATSPENREHVLEAVRDASQTVRAALRIGTENGKIVWWWPRLTLLASKPV